MSIWTRITNIARRDQLNGEIDEELESHIAEAIAQGRDPREARASFGSALKQREESRDVRMVAWLDSLRADAIFGLRQLHKRKVTSAAAILSLGLAIGGCVASFRLIDALLLRPLPISDADRLYALFRLGIGPNDKPRTSESFDYPAFRQMRATVKDQAELVAISFADRTDLTFGSDDEMEKATTQYVSGWMFESFGLRPALGRLLTEDDDLKPGAHPYAVLSYDYWTRRFGNDPKVIGRPFHLGSGVFQIVGVGPESFTGTEPGTMTSIFLPSMMNAGVLHDDWGWLRAFVRPKPGVAIEPIRERLLAVFRASNQERAKGFAGRPKHFIDHFVSQTLLLEPAAAGVSGMQKDYRLALIALGVLVTLVLLIACANVANLMTAQAAARAREMALRVSIGAGRWRLVQLVLVESAWLAFLAASVGGLFAWWSAPFVVSLINPPDNPARLILPADWRVLAFAVALALAVTFLFGLAPALRASSVKPSTALKGGESPHSRRRLMHTLIAAQAAFCFLVLFVAGLFVETFDHLSNQPTGFSSERVLILDTVSPRSQTPQVWNQVAEHLRSVPGVERVALAGWALLSGNGSNAFVSINGAPPSESFNYIMGVSPGWADTMKIPFIDGRDFRANDTYPSVAIVNETFARQYFGTINPVGRSFEKTGEGGSRIRMQIVGVVRDARHRDMREPITSTVFVPFMSQNHAALIVRTTNANPLALAAALRREVPLAQSGFRVANIRTQMELVRTHSVRERLLAMLALFFAIIALLLAGIGLYGVLDYSVLQRRREIGIRMAIGAQAGDIARRVTTDVFLMVFAGALAGLGLGMVAVRSIESLFYQVKATDIGALALPAVSIIAAVLLAALPAVIRAVRIDPVKMLRVE